MGFPLAASAVSVSSTCGSAVPACTFGSISRSRDLVPSLCRRPCPSSLSLAYALCTLSTGSCPTNVACSAVNGAVFREVSIAALFPSQGCSEISSYARLDVEDPLPAPMFLLMSTEIPRDQRKPLEAR